MTGLRKEVAPLPKETMIFQCWKDIAVMLAVDRLVSLHEKPKLIGHASQNIHTLDNPRECLGVCKGYG